MCVAVVGVVYIHVHVQCLCQSITCLSFTRIDEVGEKKPRVVVVDVFVSFCICYALCLTKVSASD
jgi:hypothetical protein